MCNCTSKQVLIRQFDLEKYKKEKTNIDYHQGDAVLEYTVPTKYKSGGKMLITFRNDCNAITIENSLILAGHTKILGHDITEQSVLNYLAPGFLRPLELDDNKIISAIERAYIQQGKLSEYNKEIKAGIDIFINKFLAKKPTEDKDLYKAFEDNVSDGSGGLHSSDEAPVLSTMGVETETHQFSLIQKEDFKDLANSLESGYIIRVV